MKQIYAIYWPILKANWQIVSLIQFVNVKFVPPMVNSFKSFHNLFIESISLIQNFVAVESVVPQHGRLLLGHVHNIQKTHG